MQCSVVIGGPFLKQRSRGIFAREICAKRLFECTAEEHSGPRILLLPTVKISVPIASRARQILADLGIAVGHCATSERTALFGLLDNSSHWLAGAKLSRLSREVPGTAE